MVIFTTIINLYDNILINKYQGLITCNRLTPLHTWLQNTHNVKVKHAIVSETLKRKAKWLKLKVDANENSKRQRAVKYPLMEAALAD